MKFLKMSILLIILLTPLAQANYLSIGESGEIINKGHYRLGASLQSTTAGKSGVNIGTFVDMGWADDLSGRFLFGVGTVDFHLGGSVKYIPFPDFQNQPAIGVKASAWLARVSDTSTTAIQLSPLVSKRVALETGEITPYLAIPLNFIYTKSSDITGTQFVVGSEFLHPDLENYLFTGELTLNLSNSESGLAIFISIPFDASKGLQRKAKRE